MSPPRLPLRFAAACAALLGAASAVAWERALEVAVASGLHFGQIVAGPGAGSVTISPDGTRSSAGGATLGSTGPARAAELVVTGDADAAYSLLLPGAAVLTGPEGTMEVTAFTHDGSGVLVGGSETVRVGATLQVGAWQSSGSHSGTFLVMVAYE